MKLYLEGLDRAGKSVTLDILTSQLKCNVVQEPAPRGEGFSGFVREMIEENRFQLNDLSMMLLFMAQRETFTHNPDELTISSRGYPSTYVYQVTDARTRYVWDNLWRLWYTHDTRTVFFRSTYDEFVRRGKNEGCTQDQVEKSLDREKYERLQAKYEELSWDLIIDVNDKTPEQIASIIIERFELNAFAL